jgi:hypothetical protein
VVQKIIVLLRQRGVARHTVDELSTFVCGLFGSKLLLYIGTFISTFNDQATMSV